jgi:hypothetical protein
MKKTNTYVGVGKGGERKRENRHAKKVSTLNLGMLSAY